MFLTIVHSILSYTKPPHKTTTHEACHFDTIDPLTMVQPGYPHDLNHGLETLYYTLRGPCSRTQQPKSHLTIDESNPHFSDKPPKSSISRTPPDAPVGSREQENKHASQQSGQNSRGRCTRKELNGEAGIQRNSPSSIGPLRIVGPKLRVDPEAKDVLLGASNPRYVSRAGKESSHEAEIKDEGDGSNVPDLRKVNPVRRSVVVVETKGDGGNDEALRFVRLGQGMEKLGLL